MNSKLIWAGAWVVLLAACTSKSDTEGVTKSGLDRSKFETTVDGKPVKLYVLENQSGMEVCVTNYGGRIVSVMVPDRDNQYRDVVLGHDSIADYIHIDGNFGALIGRYGNRIAQGRFTLDGVEYQLPQNNYGQFNSRYGATPSPTDFPQGQQQPQNPWGQPYGQTPSYGQSSPYGGSGQDGQNPNQPFPGGPAAFFFDPLGGVKPDEDLDGVSASDMAKFVQANTQYYLPVFTNQKKFRRNRFNFCAFLCTGGWMLYRKQYKLGALLTAVMAGIYFLSLYCSYASEDILLRLMSQVGIDLDTMMPSSAQLMQLGSLLAQQPAWELVLIFLPRVLNVVQLVIMIVTGIKANKTYRKFCTRKIQTIDANFPEPADREMQLRTQGGVNTPLAVGLMIAYMLAVYLPRLWLLI